VQITANTGTLWQLKLDSGNLVIDYKGNFTTTFGIITGGTITSVEISYKGQPYVSLLDLNTNFSDLQTSTDTYATMLAGADVLTGSALTDDIQGYAGNDSLTAGDGADTVRGGLGNDTISGGDGADVHVNGNQGDDLVSGGAGNDTVYGGRDNDTVIGNDGADRLSGDLGTDVLTGGAGADQFVLRIGAGADTVTDFSLAEGDRVLMATGQAYTNALVGGSVVITAGDASITLTGVAAFSTDMIAFA
jgi:Ca2+-binding RTX toxin-like protein